MTSNPTPLSSDDDRDLRQLTGAFDRPIAPCPAFAERLRQQAIAASNKERETTVDHVAPTPITTAPAREHRVIPMPGIRRSGGRILEIAAAAVLVVALLGSMFMMNRLQNGPSTAGPDSNGQRLSAVGTPSVASATPEPGSSRRVLSSGIAYQPDNAFDANAFEVQRVPNPMTSSSEESRLVAGNSLIQIGWFPIEQDGNLTQQLRVTDLATNAVRWQQTGGWGQQIAVIDNVVYAGRIQPTDNGNTIQLVALSFETGEPVFEASKPLAVEYPNGLNLSWNTLGPVTDGQNVYLTNAIGATQAINAQTGEVVWTLGGAANRQEPEPVLAGGSQLVDDQYLWVVTGDNNIRQIDKTSGKSIRVIEGFEASPRGIFLYHDGTNLIARLINADVNILEDHASLSMVREIIASIDPETGLVNWITPFAGIAGNIAVTPDHIYVPTRQTENDSIDVHVLDPADGSMHTLPHLASLDAVSITATGRDGTTLLIHDLPLGRRSKTHTGMLRIGKVVDGNTFDLLFEEEGILPSANGIQLIPPTISQAKAYIVADEGARYVIGPAAGDATPLSSPAASPQTSAEQPDARDTLLANDPGHTSAYPAGFDISQSLTAHDIGEYPGYAASGMIVGNILFAERKHLAIENPPSYSGHGLYAQDLTTGKILWRNDMMIHQRYTADASGVYILSQSETNIQHLIALDLETGEQRWSSDSLSEFSAYPESAPIIHADTPIAMDGTIYVPLVDGSVVAFDGTSGEIVWQHTPETIAPLDEVYGDASVAATSDRLYTSSGGNVISVLDRQTGSLTREIMLEDIPAKDYWLTLHVQQDHLIVEASSMGSGVSDGRIIAVDPQSGQKVWIRDTGVMQSNLLVSPTTVGVVHATFDNANPIERLFGKESTSTIQMSLFDLETGKAIDIPEGVFTPVENIWSTALASSGDTICLSYTGVTCFDPEGNVVTVESTEMPAVSSIGQELLFWNDQLVILDARHPNQITEP